MKISLKPQAYLEGSFFGRASVMPQTFLEGAFFGHAALKPSVWLCLVPETSHLEKHSINLRRVAGNGAAASADTRRQVVVANLAAADTLREVRSSLLAFSEARLARRIQNSQTEKAELARCVGGTCRVCRADTSRILSRNYAVQRGELCRKVGVTQQATTPLRMVKVLAIRAEADIRRCILTSAQQHADSRRQLKKSEREKSDTSRRVPHVLSYEPEHQSELLTSFRAQGIRSFSMTLGELTLSDTYHIETVQPLAIEAEVAGKLLDYPFRFLVEETSQQDLIQTAKGTYSRDKLLYTAINVCVDEANVSYYAEGIADALGLALDFRCDDFIPSQDFEESGMTYQDFISALFGWTAKLPHRQVNVFIRGDTLHIIQRGQEDAVTDITDWPHTRPTVDRKLVRSLWHSGRENESDQAHSDAEDAPVPFTGTISLGEISRTYDNGFLVRETNENGVTDYTYTDGYLTRKRTHNKDGSTSLTEYAYAKTGRDIYLFKETERTTEAADDGKEHDEYDWQDWDRSGSERVTYHAPLGMGWYATTVYVDGENTGSTLSQGKPGGKASRYTIDQSNLSLGSHYVRVEGKDGPSAASLIDTEFPVKDENYLAMLTEEIEWLNRRTKETVTMEIVSRVRNGVPEVKHILDFTERVRFEGSEYFLVSNQVTLTPRSLRQSITIARWY
ncbi:MAG: hypothetical protein MR665_10160 [Selenomonas bovis]|nr:hypothetical protein [Selenomonas bovis]